MGTVGLFNDDTSKDEYKIQTNVNEKYINNLKVIKKLKHKPIMRKPVYKNHINILSRNNKNERNKRILKCSLTFPINPIIKEIRKTQYSNCWRKLFDNIEKESWLEANLKIKELENQDINKGISINKTFKEEIEQTQKEMNKLSLWSKVITETELQK